MFDFSVAVQIFADPETNDDDDDDDDDKSILSATPLESDTIACGNDALLAAGITAIPVMTTVSISSISVALT